MTRTTATNKSAIILGVLLTGYSVGLLAEPDSDGAIELNAESMDGVTAAGSSLLNPASPALQALSDATGSFAMTGTSASTYVQDASTRLQYGSAAGYILAQMGSASATSNGEGASQSTQVATTPDANDPNPYGGTINYTTSVLGTEISVFSQVRPGGYALDFFHHRINNLR
jgi:hypothetical protein